MLVHRHGVACVIAWKTRVLDEAAAAFAEAFYETLANKRCTKMRDSPGTILASYKVAFKAAATLLKARHWVPIDVDENDSDFMNRLRRESKLPGMKACGAPVMYVGPDRLDPGADYFDPAATSAEASGQPLPVPTEAGKRWDYAFSLRYGEGMEKAKILKELLESKGHSVYLCDVGSGTDLMEEICGNFMMTKVIILMGTKSYGLRTTCQPIST